MKFHGAVLQSANTIFRLANKFSMRYYQSAGELGAARAPLHQSICFMSGRFDSLNFTRTWLQSVYVEVRSFGRVFICKFMLFVCTDLSHLACKSATVKYVEFSELNTLIIILHDSNKW